MQKFPKFIIILLILSSSLRIATPKSSKGKTIKSNSIDKNPSLKQKYPNDNLIVHIPIYYN